jgi:hypothetical protein
MAENHAGYQAYNNTRYGKADALKEFNSKVVGGLGGEGETAELRGLKLKFSRV